MAYIIADEDVVTLGDRVYVTAYGLESGTSYSILTEYDDGTTGSKTYFTARSSSKDWSFTPTKTGDVIITLYSGNYNDEEEEDYVIVEVTSGGSGGGGDEPDEPEEEYNSAPYVTNVSISLDSYDYDTGYGYITVSTTVYNPNPNRVYGRTSMYLPITQTADDAKFGTNSWISAYGYQYTDFTYYYYFGGSFPTTVQVRVQGSCYIDIGATSGGMAVSGYYLRSDTVDLTRPDKFYWISSYDSLNNYKGEPISDYITALKWKALQTNINQVRNYRGKTSYSFTTVSSGDNITAYLYNQIANAINDMESGTITTVTKGVTPITTEVMMALQNGINSIT